MADAPEHEAVELLSGKHQRAGEPVVRRVADGAPILRPVFGPGDALLFDNMFLHRTAADPAMTQTRYAIESWFFAPSRYPHDQVPLVF